MTITLELEDDQSLIGEELTSSLWIFKLNNQCFPCESSCLMSLDMAHQITNKLLEIETIANDES